MVPDSLLSLFDEYELEVCVSIHRSGFQVQKQKGKSALVCSRSP